MNIKIKTRDIDAIRATHDAHGKPIMEIKAFMWITDMKETLREFLKVVPAPTWDAWCKEFNQEEE